jgi:rhodanese-related sulfurtransferase/DNA-binding transcriptional ArsR family regulator
MEKRVFKDNIYAAIAGMAKAFGNANRLEILDLLANGEKSVEQIAAQTEITVANASQHLQVLKSARLVEARREGNFIYYALKGKRAYAVWRALRDMALEQEPAVQVTLRQFRKEMDSPESVSLENLPAGERIVLIDVRPAGEFDEGHLPDAHSIPIGELPDRLEELPRDKTIVAYCRGAFCTYADEAVQLLKANGFQAVRLEETYLDYKLLNDDQWLN